jgi:hypothetical protein
MQASILRANFARKRHYIVGIHDRTSACAKSGANRGMLILLTLRSFGNPYVIYAQRRANSS